MYIHCTAVPYIPRVYVCLAPAAALSPPVACLSPVPSESDSPRSVEAYDGKYNYDTDSEDEPKGLRSTLRCLALAPREGLLWRANKS